MLAIQPRSLLEGHEELTPVGVGSCVGHRQLSRLAVLQGEVLVLELLPVDRLSSGAVAVGEVSALKHESLDQAVESTVQVMQVLPRLAHPLLASAQGTEVLGRLGTHIRVEFHL